MTPGEQSLKILNFSFAIFALCWIVIVGVSSIDTYFAIKYSDVLYHMELNPVGRWLIEADGGDVSLFMAAKLFGTWLASFFGMLLFLYRRSLGIITSLAVCMMQIALLFFLTMG